MVNSAGMGELLRTGIPLSCYKLDLLKHTIPAMEYVPSREGERMGVLVRHIPPQSISHLRVLPRLGNLDGIRDLVQFLKLQPP